MLYRSFVVAIFFSAFHFPGSRCLAQASPGSGPVDHMRDLGAREELLSTKYMSYMSEVAHGGRARKMEKRREELIASVREAIREGGKLRPYKGDSKLRDAYKEYWTVLLSVFTEDYHKIVDMEEVAEQSYDAMEAYLMVQEKAGQTVEAAYKKVAENYKAFALEHGVTLVEGEKSKLTSKLEESGRVNGYLNTMYLIFFKSFVQEGLMLKGTNDLDINAVEQSKSSMAKYAAEGLGRLDTAKAFKNDASLINACRKVLEFHKSEADKAAAFSSFLIQHEEFEKIKKTFDAKPANRRTQADVDVYNKAIRDFNSAITTNNKLNKELNDTRAKVMDGWNSARKRFMDLHVPHK